uniref:Uncharacterized protein n=1 Tax=Loa loa TaxID=7209 RepID=A0A1I7W174_LOALO
MRKKHIRLLKAQRKIFLGDIGEMRIARRQRWWKRSRSRIGGGRRPMIQIFPKTLYVFADKSSILVSEDMILPRPWTVQRRM